MFQRTPNYSMPAGNRPWAPGEFEALRENDDEPARAAAWLEAHAERILEAWRNAGSPENPRVLFSAHGLP